MQIRIWFPKFLTEAHRFPWEGAALVTSLAQYGIECVPELDESCQLIFCGAFSLAREIREQVQVSGLPIVHYNWDLYPFQIEGRHELIDYGNQWLEYIEDLKTCTEIIVPSKCTTIRTIQYTGRSATVVRSAVRTFREPVKDGGYVLNAIRDYPDPNRTAVKDACEELGIPFVNSGNNLPWDEFKRVVAECRLIVSAPYEASTGGLSLLEAYALGKPVLLCNSPHHGGVDYFGDRADYFQWDDCNDLKRMIKELYERPPRLNPEDCWNWVNTEFSNQRMAKQLADVFRRCLNVPNNYLSSESHVNPFQKVHWYQDETGYIVWRVGTGNNVELLHLNATAHRKGYGRNLVKHVLKQLSSLDTPYHSMFGFTRETNEEAVGFYRAMGFELTPIPNLYREGTAIMFCQSYFKLKELHNVS